MEDIRSIAQHDLAKHPCLRDEKPFRVKQITEWLYRKGIQDFGQMKNVPAATITLLKEHFTFSAAHITTVLRSNDKTIKTAFQLTRGGMIEGVLIPSGDRVTACISSQAGCKLNCSFCATARMKSHQNLLAGEIIDQVFQLNILSEKEYNTGVSNIVLMGMGEPLLNYDEVMTAINHITEKEGMGISPRRITLSTAGIVPGIRRLAANDVKFNLAVSLHSADDRIRSSIMPVNKKYPLAELSGTLQEYHHKTRQRITIEYILFDKLNDSVEDAKKLAVFCRAFPCKINIIEYNPVKGTGFKPSSDERTEAFSRFLESRNMIVNIRRSRGKDIDAACGQLAGKKT